MNTRIQSEVVAVNKSAATTTPLPRKLGDKRDVAQLAGMSRRWVDGEMAKGMPHLKLGTRRCKFDLEEVAEWLRQQYHVQRRGKLNGEGK
jgi:predicted DNA-binding transcriptional regulator AlpA